MATRVGISRYQSWRGSAGSGTNRDIPAGTTITQLPGSSVVTVSDRKTGSTATYSSNTGELQSVKTKEGYTAFYDASGNMVSARDQQGNLVYNIAQGQSTYTKKVSGLDQLRQNVPKEFQGSLNAQQEQQNKQATKPSGKIDQYTNAAKNIYNKLTGTKPNQLTQVTEYTPQNKIKNLSTYYVPEEQRITKQQVTDFSSMARTPEKQNQVKLYWNTGGLDYFKEKEQRYQTEYLRNYETPKESTIAKSYLFGGAAGIVALPIAVKNALFHPIKTSVGMWTSAPELGRQAKQNPAWMASYFGSQALASKGLGKAYEYSPVKLELEAFKHTEPVEVLRKTKEGKFELVNPKNLERLPFKVPEPKEVPFGKVVGVSVSGKGHVLLYRDILGKSTSLFKVPKEINVPKLLGKTKEFQPTTFSGAKVFKENLPTFIKEPAILLEEGKKVPVNVQIERASLSLEATRELRKIKIPRPKEQPLKQGTQLLTVEETKAALNLNLPEKKIVMGSGARYDILHPEVKTKLPHDIDLVIKNMGDEARLAEITKLGKTAFEKVSKEKFRVPEAEPYTIEKFVNGKWEKVQEFKGKGIGAGDEVPAKAFGYDLDLMKDTQKVSKRLEISASRMEMKRLLAASVGIRGERQLGVTHAGRVKDVPNFAKIIYSQMEYAKSLGKKTPAAEKLIAHFEKTGVDFKLKEGEFITQVAEPKSPKGKSPFMVSHSFKNSLRTNLDTQKLSNDISKRIQSSAKLKTSSALSRSVSSALSKKINVSRLISPSVSVSARSPSPRSPSPYASPSPSPKSPSPFSPSPSPVINFKWSPIISPSPELSGGGFRMPKFKTPARVRQAYNPDFTARALGITMKATQKNIQRAMNKRYTGLEVRAGIVR